MGNETDWFNTKAQSLYIYVSLLLLGTPGRYTLPTHNSSVATGRRNHHSRALKGALIGGAAGVVGGALINGKKGALIGAGAGAGTGYLVQRHRNKKRSRRRY
ncbi:MAG: YMGG-like glycine zipper-containing protein [Pyrinomonadaceae bacterium]